MATETLREQQKNEALERMKALKIMGSVCNDFRNNGRVYYSERQNEFFDGILYWLDNEEEYVKLVNEFEKKHGYMVYHAQLSHTMFGDMLALFFVSDRKSEWSEDREMMANGDMYSYVYNLTNPCLSEFGLIGVAPKNGGVTRTY